MRSKQICKGHVTDIMSILMLLSSLLSFYFTIFRFGSLVFGKNKFGISITGQIGKTAFTAEVFTVAKTLMFI